MGHTDETPERASWNGNDSSHDEPVEGRLAGDSVPQTETEIGAGEGAAGGTAAENRPSRRHGRIRRGARKTGANDVDEQPSDDTTADNAADDGPDGDEHGDDEFAGTRAIEALYGRELSKARDRVRRWRVRQAKEAFGIGDLWTDLTERLSAKEVSAFLASECQIPRRDVSRYVRLAKVLGDDRKFYIESGVAVSVLLDLAGQDEPVRDEAVRMIRSGRALQAKDLRSLKRDIGLAKAAADGELDTSRRREFRNIAARKARAAADAWLASLGELIIAADKVSEFDKFKGNTLQSSPKKTERLANRAGKLIEELPAIVGKEFAKTPVPANAGLSAANGSWQQVFATLRDMSKGRMFIEERYERPETTVYDFAHHMVWDLAWAFGYDSDARPEAAIRRVRDAGAVPLDTEAEDGRVRAETNRTPTVLEICAGAGGQALGLEAAGFRHVGLVEIDRDAAATMEHNGPDWPVINADLRGLDLSRFEGVDLLAGGVPCQPYSTAGDLRGAHDERDLFPEALRLIRELKPKAVMLENVTGALHVGNAVNRLRILSELTGLGYEAEWRILEAPDFGVPQKRRRAVLVGFRPGIMHRFRWPAATGRSAPTVGGALYDLVAANGWKHVGAWREKANDLAPTLIGGSSKKKGIDLAQKKSRGNWTKIGVNPSGKANAAPGPDAPRDHLPKLTLEMMARIQDFPDGWKFQGSNLEAFHQIANAFPPGMALAIGTSIMRALTGSEIDLSQALLKPVKKKRRLNLGTLEAEQDHHHGQEVDA